MNCARIRVCDSKRKVRVFLYLPFLRFTIFQQMRVSLGVPVFAVLHSQSSSLRNGGISAAACARGQDTILKSQTHTGANQCCYCSLMPNLHCKGFREVLLKWHLGVFTQKA